MSEVYHHLTSCLSIRLRLEGQIVNNCAELQEQEYNGITIRCKFVAF